MLSEDDDSADAELREMQREWKRRRAGTASPAQAGVASLCRAGVASPCRAGVANPCRVAASATPSKQAELVQLGARSQERDIVEEVEWLQFVMPEIEEVRAIFANKPLLINTMCSGIQARAALNYNNDCLLKHSNPPATTEITA